MIVVMMVVTVVMMMASKGFSSPEETQPHFTQADSGGEMKMNVLLFLLGLFLHLPADGRPVEAVSSHHVLLPRPLLLHLGEEFSLQLGGGAAAPEFPSSSSSSSAVNRALLLLTQRLLQAEKKQQDEEDEGGQKGRRSEEPPLSLDLTFHLLREVLEMARAEQMAQQAHSNRRMMDTFGK
ncbi:corticoliberin-like [Melanotaenia boesemani]|uniref:corticoliberin-like n=1 Tax=Melanotaenia boesemani TaxID=1250792 RepID=UPI001C03D0BE|nr:corticoliberin-like [Melanotaenia boesemani]